MAKKKVGIYMIIRDDCIVEVYTKNEDSFSVGKVYCQNKDDVVFCNIDVQGKIDGYYVMKKSSVTNIVMDTEYLKKMEKYMEYGEKHSYASWFSLTDVKFDISQSLFTQVIKYAETNGIIITIGMIDEEELETGYVREISQNNLVLECINLENAHMLGCITVNMEDITFIEFESIDNKLLQYANTVHVATK